MLKICFVTTVSMTLETFLLDTAIMLTESGYYSVTLISSHDDDFRKKLPESINFIPVRMKRGITFGTIKVIYQLFKVFKTEKFDIVQYSTPNASLYASISSFFARVETRIYAQWGIRYVGFNSIKRFIFRNIEKIVCKLSTNIFSVSKLNMEFGISEKLYKAHKVKVIGNGGTIGVDFKQFNVDLKKAYRGQINLKYQIDNTFVFGFVGRLTKDKGALELIESFIAIRKKHKVKLMIIGPNELDTNIKGKFDKNLIFLNDVIFTGLIKKEYLCQYYSRFDCFVHPTYREGFGMVIQEAAAMKLPIITTRIPGASEVMEENISCLIVAPKNSMELLTAMERVLSDKNLQETLGNNAYLRAAKLYSRETMLNNQYLEYKKFAD